MFQDPHKYMVTPLMTYLLPDFFHQPDKEVPETMFYPRIELGSTGHMLADKRSATTSTDPHSLNQCKRSDWVFRDEQQKNIFYTTNSGRTRSSNHWSNALVVDHRATEACKLQITS